MVVSTDAGTGSEKGNCKVIDSGTDVITDCGEAVTEPECGGLGVCEEDWEEIGCKGFIGICNPDVCSGRSTIRTRSCEWTGDGGYGVNCKCAS